MTPTIGTSALCEEQESKGGRTNAASAQCVSGRAVAGWPAVQLRARCACCGCCWVSQRAEKFA